MLVLLFLLPTLSLALTDYLIVGSGPGGCALAARLCTALPDRKILLLERGLPLNDTERLLVQSPRLAQDAWKTRLVESIETAPNPGLFGKTVTFLNGNVLGGASAVNALQWNVPPVEQVMSWGVEGLTKNRIKELFEKARAQTGVFQPGKDLRHGFWKEWTAGASRVGLNELRNPFGADQGRDGVYYNFVTTKESGQRLDACTAYVDPVRETCKNLEVMQGVTVTKLLVRTRKGKLKRRAYKCNSRGQCKCRLVQGERKVVRGVEYVQTSAPKLRKTLLAAETILSAGPINSPQLLQLSGVGDRTVLRQAGIGIKKKLPVGKKVESRSLGLVTSMYDGIGTLPDNDPKRYLSQSERKRFLSGRRGLLGKTIAGMNGRLGKDILLQMSNVFESNGPLTGIPAFITACLVHPTSTGSILIKSRKAMEPPILNLNYLGDDKEKAVLTSCMKKVRDLHKSIFPTIDVREIRPGAEAVMNESVVAENTFSAYHSVGGCRLGDVVNGDFRLRGVEGVRVVDSSVIPSMPQQAGPMSSIYMLAEWAAQLIAGEDRCGVL